MFSPDDDYYTEDLEAEYYAATGHLPRHHPPTLPRPPSMKAQMKLEHRSTPTRVSIREANEHLQLLHQRVSDLEDIIRSQGIALSEKDAHYRQQLKELKESKERHIDELSRNVVKLEEKNHELEAHLIKSKAKLTETQEKLAHLDKFLANSLPIFERFLSELKQFTLKTTELNQVINSVNQEQQSMSNSQQSINLISIKSTNNTPEKKQITSLISCQSKSTTNSPIKQLINNNINNSLNCSPQLTAISNALKLNETASDSGLPSSSNNSESSRANSYNLVLHELKGHYEKALQREQQLEERERDTVSEPILPNKHHHQNRTRGSHTHRSAKVRNMLVTNSAHMEQVTMSSKRSLPKVDSHGHHQSNGHHSLQQQMRTVGKSFSITANFSSEDDLEDVPAPAPPASKSSNTNLPALQAPRIATSRYYQSTY